MAKPEKQKSSGIACIIDGIITKRVQTLGSNVDITREQAVELANTGVVEFVSDAPVVSIQIDTNDVGSTDTLALLTDKMITYTDTAGNDPRGGTESTRFFIKTDSSNSQFRPIKETDMTEGYCSILATMDEGGTAAARTMWMNHCAITGVSLSYDVSGNASENYTLTSDNKTWFLNDWAGVRCFKPQFYQIGPGEGSDSDRGIVFQYLDSAIPDDSSVVAIGINGDILRVRGFGVEGNATIAEGGTQGFKFTATTYALSTPFVSTAAGSTDRIWIIYKPSGTSSDLWEATSDAASPGWELESSAGALGAVRRGQIKAFLFNTNSSSRDTAAKAGKALRLQTISIDVALSEEQLFELGRDGFYGISKNTPVPITVTLTANDSDLEYFANLLSTAASDTNVKQIAVEDFNGFNAIKIEIYRDKSQTTLLKTIDLTGLFVQNENFNISVGDNATNEITLTNDNITIVGSGTNVTGGWYGAL